MYFQTLCQITEYQRCQITEVIFYTKVLVKAQCILQTHRLDLRAHGVHHENTLSAAALNQFNVTLIETMLKCHYYCQFQSIFTVEIGPLDEWRDVYFSGR